MSKFEHNLELVVCMCEDMELRKNCFRSMAANLVEVRNPGSVKSLPHKNPLMDLDFTLIGLTREG